MLVGIIPFIVLVCLISVSAKSKIIPLFWENHIRSSKRKYSFIVFLFAFNFTVVGQELPEGQFVYSTGFTTEAFTFKKDKSFEYKYSSCTYGKEGCGNYAFEKGMLVLTFENPKDNLPLKPTQTTNETKNDTSYLSFKFFNQIDTTSVSGVIVSFTDKSSSKSYGTQSNLSGEANIKIKNSNIPLTLEIDMIGMQSKSLRIDTIGNYSISFPLSFEFVQPLVEGDILQFSIEDFSNKRIVLKPIDEKKFRTFKTKR